MPGTAFITGATGFLGCWIARRFLEAGWRVVGFDRTLNFDRVRLVVGSLPADGATWIGGDVTDMAEVDRAIEQAGPDVIVHLAAALIPLCREQPAAAAAVNVTGHINVFEAARRHRVPRIVYASSVASRSRAETGALSTAYGTFKLWSEEYSATYFDQHGVSSVGLRPDIVYGPGRQSGETAFVNAAISDVAKGIAHCLRRRWSMRLEYVEEVADVFFRCATSPFSGAHGSDITATITNESDLVMALKQAVADCRLTFQPDGPTLVSPKADLSPISTLIGDWPHVSLAEGVRRTIEQMRFAPS